MESEQKSKLVFLSVVLGLGVAALAWVYWPWEKAKRTPEELVTEALQSDNPIAQQRATIELQRQKATGELIDVYRRSTDKDMRASAIQALGDTEVFRTIPTLFEAMDDTSPTVRGAAAAAITRMIGADFHYDATASASEREKTMKQMRNFYERFKGNPPPKYRDPQP